jgi:hypothetical protein
LNVSEYITILNMSDSKTSIRIRGGVGAPVLLANLRQLDLGRRRGPPERKKIPSTTSKRVIPSVSRADTGACSGGLLGSAPIARKILVPSGSSKRQKQRKEFELGLDLS